MLPFAGSSIRNDNFFLKKIGQSRPLFVYFRYFLDTISIIQFEKSVDGVLGIRTWGRRMVGGDETTELWQPPNDNLLIPYFLILISSKKSFITSTPE